jgi:hypothetical protein
MGQRDERLDRADAPRRLPEHLAGHGAITRREAIGKARKGDEALRRHILPRNCQTATQRNGAQHPATI